MYPFLPVPSLAHLPWVNLWPWFAESCGATLANYLPPLFESPPAPDSGGSTRPMANSTNDLPALTARPRNTPVPLTPNQMWVWNDVLRRDLRLSRARLCAESTRLTGPLDVRSLERSIESLLHRHESLRTRIVEIDGVPMQCTALPAEYHLPLEDLAPTDSARREACARGLAASFIHKDVDLSSEKIFQAKLLRISELDHVLVVGVDHIVADGVSCALLSHEIWQTYWDFMQAGASALGPPKVQFPDFVAWQHATRPAWQQSCLPYWEAKLKSIPTLRMPHDHRPSDPERPAGAILHIPFGKHLTSSLREAARASSTLLPILVLTLYCAQLFLRRGHRDILITFLSHGRHARPELRSMIGDLAHCTYLRIEVTRQDSLNDLARATAAEFEAATAKDASQLSPPSSLEFPTDFYFNWNPRAAGRVQEIVPQNPAARVELVRRPFPLAYDTPVKFAPNFYDGPSGLVLTILFRSDLYRMTTMQCIGDDLKWLGMKFIENPRVPLGTLILPPVEERACRHQVSLGHATVAADDR